MKIGILLDQFVDDGEKFRLKSIAAKSSRFSEEISLSKPILEYIKKVASIGKMPFSVTNINTLYFVEHFCRIVDFG